MISDNGKNSDTKRSYRRDNGDRPSRQQASDIIDRAPPVDIQAEMAVIGCTMIDPDCLNEVGLVLRADDFYDDANRMVYHQIIEMHDSGRKIDITLLVNELKKASEYELIGGAQYLAKLASSVPNAAHAGYYAEIVRNKSTMRKLIEASSQILRDAYEDSSEPKELVSQAEQRILSIQDERSGQGATTIKDAMNASMARINARMKGEDLGGGVLTHFTDFDKMTNGFHDGELLILAARPSMGKTALALNMAYNVAVLGQAPTLFVSLEMSAIELADRILVAAAEVKGKELRDGTITQDDRQRLVQSAMHISNMPLYVDDSPSRTVSEVAAVARRINQNEQRRPEPRRLGLIVIDYLQLLDPDNPKDPRQEQVAKIARRLKMLAREQEVPILCLAQLNRQSEEGKDHRPRLSHLRESGAIEQDADVVMFVHREEYYLRDEAKLEAEGQAQILIAKQRNGPVGDVNLVWQKDFMRFRDAAPEHHSDFADGPMSPGGY